MNAPRWAATVLISATALLALLALDAPPVLRLPLTLWFLLACPGMAFVPLLSIRPRAVELAVGLAASIAIDAVAALLLLYSGVGFTRWSAISLISGACVVGCGLQWVLLPPRDPDPADPGQPADGAATSDVTLGVYEQAATSGGAGLAPISLSSADMARLSEVDGIGAVLAARIVAWRSAHGDFASVDQLLEIPGIGPARLKSLRSRVVR